MKRSASLDWSAIERDYAAGDMPIAALCAAHGVSSSAVYARARRHGWPRRRAPARQRQPQKGGMIARLLRALDEKMTDFETRLASGHGGSAAESERDAKTLNLLLRMFEKLSELQGDARAGVALGPRHGDGDADALRRDFAQRLEKLRRAGGD